MQILLSVLAISVTGYLHKPVLTTTGWGSIFPQDASPKIENPQLRVVMAYLTIGIKFAYTQLYNRLNA